VAGCTRKTVEEGRQARETGKTTEGGKNSTQIITYTRQARLHDAGAKGGGGEINRGEQLPQAVEGDVTYERGACDPGVQEGEADEAWCRKTEKEMNLKGEKEDTSCKVTEGRDFIFYTGSNNGRGDERPVGKGHHKKVNAC